MKHIPFKKIRENGGKDFKRMSHVGNTGITIFDSNCYFFHIWVRDIYKHRNVYLSSHNLVCGSIVEKPSSGNKPFGVITYKERSSDPYVKEVYVHPNDVKTLKLYGWI